MQLIKLAEDYSFGSFDCGEADLRSMPGLLKKRSRSPHSSNISYFCAVEKKERDMTTMQMNAELFRELSVIAEDEGMMEKAIKALRRITSARKKAMSKNWKKTIEEDTKKRNR